MVLLLMTVLCTYDQKDYSPLVDWAGTSGTLNICICEKALQKKKESLLVKRFIRTFFIVIKIAIFIYLFL